MLKLNVGLSRKVGEPNYGSRGASVNLELEIESTLASEPDLLKERIRALFGLARSAVDEELQRQGGVMTDNGQQGSVPTATASAHSQRTHARTSRDGERPTSRRVATASQVRAIHAIANRHHVDLASQLRDRFGVERPEELSLGDASELIDSLKAGSPS